MKKIMQKTCRGCGIMFDTHKNNQTYCNRECRLNYQTPKKNEIEKFCIVCGKSFIVYKNSEKKYCSSKCYGLDHRKETEEYFFRNKMIGYFQIFKRDDFRCAYCGKNVFQDKIKLVVDHIEPRKNGVDNNIINLVTSCKECNAFKSSTPLSPEIVDKIKTETLKRTLEHKLEYAKLKDYFDNVWKH